MYAISYAFWDLVLSSGVTLYQCATGSLPFEPKDGVRKDRKTM